MKYKMHAILLSLMLICLTLIFMIDPLGIATVKTNAANHIVIVIDPGHGGPGTTDEQELGAKYNNVVEKDLTLITAEAMKTELEKYGNVTVYLTRTSDQTVTLANRAAFAASVGATAMISLHYNASSEHNFYGAEVFTSAFGQYYATGTGIASCILDELSASGAASKGSKTRIGQSGADYYGLIRHGVTNNIPTIIVEHGYIDNETDWNRINNISAWQQLGVRDATAIARYYGLQKEVLLGDITPTVTVAVPGSTMLPDLTPPANVSVTITDQDSASGKVICQILASEPESTLMYYTYSLDDGLTYTALKLWDGGASQTASLEVPADYSGKLLVKVYNNYELDAVSPPVSISLEDTKEALSDDALSDLSSLPTASSSTLDTSTVSASVATSSVSNSSTDYLWADSLQASLDKSEIVITPAPPKTNAFSIKTILILSIAIALILTIVGAIIIRKSLRKKRRRR